MAVSVDRTAGAAGAPAYVGGAVGAWFAVTVLIVLSIISSLDRYLVSLLVDPIRKDLQLSDFQIGLVQGLGFGLFYAAFGVPMGWLVDRFPRRRIICLGVAFWSLSAAGTGLARSFGSLFAARLGVGAGEASLFPAAYSLISEIFPKRRLALALGVFGAATSVGAGISLWLGGMIAEAANSLGVIEAPLVGVLQPWRLVFIVTGLPGLAFALLAFLLPEPRRARRAAVAAAGRAADGFLRFFRASSAFFTCHFLGFGGLAILGYGMITWAPVFAIRRFGLGLAETGVLVGVIQGVCGVAGYVFHGWLADRLFARGMRDIHLRYYVVTYLLAGGVGVFCFQFAPSVWVFGVCYAVLCFLQPFVGPAVAALQLVTPPEYRGRVSALFLLVMNGMGLCLGPPIVAAFTEFLFDDPARVGSSIALMFAVVTPLVVIPLVIGLRHARDAQLAAESAG
jgi:MFS family permease